MLKWSFPAEHLSHTTQKGSYVDMRALEGGAAAGCRGKATSFFKVDGFDEPGIRN